MSSLVNRAGFRACLGKGSGSDKYYCARRLGTAVIPGSDGQCGPSNGPQCPDCRGYTTSNPPPIASSLLNKAGIPCALGTGAGSEQYYCARRLGTALIPGSDGQCGPNNGPQCPDCRGYTKGSPPSSTAQPDVPRYNRAGAVVALGSGATADNYYCSRVLGKQVIPGSDGQCGPGNGPQCPDCKGYTRSNPPPTSFSSAAAANPVKLLGEAAMKNDVARIKQLLPSVDINAKDSESAYNSALHMASKSDAVAAIDYLLDSGANINLVNKYDATPLHLAACNTQPKACERLCARGANNAAGNCNNATALHLAAETNSAECIKILLRYGADVNARNRWGSTPIYLAVDKELILPLRALLDGGAKVDSQNEKGNCALHLAVQKKSSECAIELLKRGANASLKNAAGDTPLSLATKANKTDIVAAINASQAMAWTSATPAFTLAPAASPSKPTTPPVTWDDAEVGQWLVFLNLTKYAKGFQENAVDGACLKEGLDNETLDAIGVTLPIHRKKLQNACIDLFPHLATELTPPATPPPVSREKTTAAPKVDDTSDQPPEYEFDVFLSHDWGKDSRGRDNHERVIQINELLKDKGFKTWFDNERMTGDIVAMMCDGVEKSATFVSCITQRYVNKVGSINDDNCKAEFNHAVRRRTTRNIIPVVMEDRMRNTNSWSGPVGMRLGDVLYVRMWEDEIAESVEQLSAEIVKRYPECASRVTLG